MIFYVNFIQKSGPGVIATLLFKSLEIAGLECRYKLYYACALCSKTSRFIDIHDLCNLNLREKFEYNIAKDW